MIDQTLVSRIQKMHAKAVSAKELGNEHEHLAFASAVQRLLIKHDLEMSDVEALAEERDNPIKYHLLDPRTFGMGKQKRAYWMDILIAIIAKAHDCGIILIDKEEDDLSGETKKTNSLLIVGQRDRRQICEMMSVILCRFAEAESQRAYVRHFYECRRQGDVTMARGYKQDWLTGFVYRVKQRYDEAKQATIEELFTDPQAQKHALIRLNKQLARVSEVREQILGASETTRRDVKVPKVKNLDGFTDGMEAGDRVNIHQAALAQEQRTRRVGAGQRLLSGGA